MTALGAVLLLFAQAEKPRAKVLEGDRVPMAGYLVRLDGWPELLKLSDRHTHWGHSTEPPGSFGKIVPGSSAAAERADEYPTPHSRRTTYRLADGSRCVFTFSRLSPALWMDCRPRSFMAFQGAAPRYLAYPSVQGVSYLDRPGASVAGDQIKESWVLAWRGADSPKSLSFVPSFLHAAPNPLDREDYEKFVKPQPADAPWLVVFQTRPLKLALEADGLKAEFAGPAGTTCFLPLGGVRWYRGAETAAWAGKLPPEVAARCRTWNRYLKFFPEALDERVEVDGDAVHVHSTFRLSSVTDEWKTDGRRLVPVRPVTALALLSKLKPLSTSPSALVDLDYPTLTGAWAGFEDTFNHTVTFTGWKAYASVPPSRPPRLRDPRLAEKLEAHVRDMLEAGHLAPYESFQGTLQYSFWGNPGDLSSTLLAARRHVGAELQKGIDDYLRAESAKYPILKVGWTPPGEGVRREPHPVDLSVKDVVGRRRKEEPARIENLYGLWEHSAHFKDWGWMEKDWELVREIVRKSNERLDWEFGLARGGVHDLNLRVKGLVGYAELARQKREPRDLDEAAHLLTQALVNRFAFAKLSEHRFLSRQFHVPEGFDLPRFHARNAHKFNIFLPAYRKGADYRTAPQVGWVGPIDGHARESRYLSEIGNFWHDHAILAWADLTPPLARFLAETTMPELRNYLACIEEGLPTWYVTRAENLHAIGEDAYHSPYMSWPIFQAKAMIFREPAASLARYVDLPYGRGDLYFIQNIAAALEAD